MVVEYPKRVYKDSESVVVNTKEEELNFLGVCESEVKNEPSVQCENIETVAAIEQKIEPEILRRKPGRPHKKI